MIDWFKVTCKMSERQGATKAALAILVEAIDPEVESLFDIDVALKHAKETLAEVEAMDVYEGAEIDG